MYLIQDNFQVTGCTKNSIKSGGSVYVFFYFRIILKKKQYMILLFIDLNIYFVINVKDLLKAFKTL